MKTIAQCHQEFERVVLPPSAGEVQRREMRRAFYSGAYAALLTCLEAAAESMDDDEQGEALIQALHDECRRFATDVAEGRA